jgi:cytochrome c
MDSWEWNKLAAAVLGTLAFVLAVHLAAEAIFTVPPPAKPGYVAAEPAPAPPPAADSAKTPENPPGNPSQD